MCGLKPPTYDSNVTQMTEPKRRGRPVGYESQQTIAARKREGAWHALASYTDGALDTFLVREVHRRHRIMQARAYLTSNCTGDLTDSILSVVDDVKAGRL
jgi:hypothetical protein